jgi:hypothetical protein
MNLHRSLSFRLLAPALAGAFLLTGASQLRADPRVSVGVSIGVPFPHGYAEIRVGHDNYYYHRGTYYRPGPRGYHVVRAPYGARIRELPPHCSRIYLGGVWYWRFGDDYYRPYEDGYVVVEPPTTIVVKEAPPPAPAPVAEQSVWVGDKEYVFKNGQFFTKTPEGLVWAEAPLGAITKALPAESTSVWYQGVEYFECDEVYFHKTPNGYEVVRAPWKK